ncbi:uncharacterized protein LOC110460022 [Mizuhopecten yessoensis]|uniref:uncharacterized protein LOC110460022 n=1 Tax=Mizuhopecten yessoensis TaxID=6573 RepID=UPI000B45E40D|nr:uncharacterized protein LOC110460022 [Mizuhopecten yessoensis]
MAKMLSIPRTRPSRYVDDLHASPAWHAFTEEVGSDAIALSYCSDGFNPFHHNITAGNYSIWAQTGLILNLPAKLHSKKTTTMLFGLIAGPRAPKRLNIYNEVIIDELVRLDQGIGIYDAFMRKSSILRARVMFTVCDVPGNAKEQNRVQQNAKASCGHCHLKGTHSKILDKTVYPGGRTFLEKDHPLRFDTSFPTRSIEEAVAVSRTKSDEIAMSIFCDKLEHQSRDLGTNNKTRFHAITPEHGRYGSSQWLRLSYMDMQSKHSPVEPMHAIKVVAEHVTKLLNGDEDGSKVRAQERSMNRFANSCPDDAFQIYVKEKTTLSQMRKRKKNQPLEGTGNVETASEPCHTGAERSFPKSRLPPAPFTLNNDQKKAANSRLASMRFPKNFGDVPDTLFTNICGGMKSHTWNQLYTTGVLRYCLRGMLGEQQRKSLNEFLLGLEGLFKTPTDMDTIDQLAERWHITLCTMERDFPLSLQSYVMHLLHHLPQYVKLYGAPSNFWMFPYERFNKTLSECITNARNLELNAVKKMEMHWLVSMLGSAGYLEPLNCRPEPSQKVLHFLQPGTHKPSPRQISQVERDALTDLLGKPLTNQFLSVYHYAQRIFGQTEVRYRDTSMEERNQHEKSSVVSCYLPQGQFLVKSSTFLSSQCKIKQMNWLLWSGLGNLNNVRTRTVSKYHGAQELPLLSCGCHSSLHL